MCGICGWVRPLGVELSHLVRMNQVASHRGPDGEGYWLWDGESATGQFLATYSITDAPQHSKVALGSRRLAILDLSSAGLQPMPSQNWAGVDHIQRRDLQLCGTPQRTDPTRSSFPDGHGYGGDSGRL